MKYTGYDMNAYNLHIIKTDKFKTVTVGVAFRKKILKEILGFKVIISHLEYYINKFLQLKKNI